MSVGLGIDKKSKYFGLLHKFYNGKPGGFWYFCQAYLSSLFSHFPHGREMIEPQRDMIAQLLDPTTRFLADRRLATMWYRGGGKTTTSDAFAVYLIVGKWYNDQLEAQAAAEGVVFNRNDPAVFLRETRFMVIYSFTEEAAKLRTETIAKCFRDKASFPELVSDFGMLLNPPKSSAKKNIYEQEDMLNDDVMVSRGRLMFNHGVRVVALGMGQAIQGANLGGGRPDFLRFDDPESPLSRDNKVDLFKRNINFITADCYRTLDIWRGRIHVIGTNIAAGCTIDVLTSPTSRWRKNVFPQVSSIVPSSDALMYSDEQVSTDPQRFPMDLIRAEYENAKESELGLLGFLRDRYNISYDPNSIDATKIKFYERGEIVRLRSAYTTDALFQYSGIWKKVKRAVVTLGVDGGGAKAGNNKTALVVSALTEDNELIVLDSYLVNKPSMTMAGDGYFDDIYRTALAHQVKRIVFEAFGGGYGTVFENLVVYIQKLDRERGTRVSSLLAPFTDNSKSKKERAFPVLKTYIESGRFYLPTQDSDVFLKQIKSMTAGGGEDDYIDAVVLSQHDNLIPPPYRNISETPSYKNTNALKKSAMMKKIYGK